MRLTVAPKLALTAVLGITMVRALVEGALNLVGEADELVRLVRVMTMALYVGPTLIAVFALASAVAAVRAGEDRPDRLRTALRFELRFWQAAALGTVLFWAALALVVVLLATVG